MDVLITGGAGTVGTAITDALADDDRYALTSLDREEHPDPDVASVIADATDYDDIRPHFDGVDAVVHLAYAPLDVGGPWERTIEWLETHAANLRMHANVIRAAIDAGVDSLVYASSNHAVGMYEVANAPDIYYQEFDLTVDRSASPRPDSMYGTFYALRIGAVRDPAHDHPYGDAEAGVEAGEFDRDSQAYRQQVARLKALWQSRRDFAHMVDRCLRDDTVAFDVFYGVSDNDRRWLDIDHARAVLGYDPRDNGEEWDAPPG